MALGKSLEEVLDMPYEHILAWGAYYSVEPFGPWRDDFRAAQICSVLANINRDPEKRSEAWTPEDFMWLFRDKPKEEMNDILSPETRAFLYASARSKSA